MKSRVEKMSPSLRGTREEGLFRREHLVRVCIDSKGNKLACCMPRNASRIHALSCLLVNNQTGITYIIVAAEILLIVSLMSLVKKMSPSCTCETFSGILYMDEFWYEFGYCFTLFLAVK